MFRNIALVTLVTLLFSACSTSAPAAAPEPVDPTVEPTIAGAVDEAVLEGSIQGETAAETGRRIGRIAGIVAAVVGGPETETIDETVDRYRRTRDAVEATAAVIGATKGAVAGAERGYKLDLAFAELTKIEGIETTRPYIDRIEVRAETALDEATITAIATVLSRATDGVLHIDAFGDTGQQLTDAAVALGASQAAVTAYPEEEPSGVVISIGYAEDLGR